MGLERREILRRLFESKKGVVLVYKVSVSAQELTSEGWGMLPTAVPKAYGEYSIRKTGSAFEVIHVQPWMRNKKPPTDLKEEPLPINAKPLDLKSMYKKK